MSDSADSSLASQKLLMLLMTQQQAQCSGRSLEPACEAFGRIRKMLPGRANCPLTAEGAA